MAGCEPGPCGRIPFDEVVIGDTETTGLAPFGIRDGERSGDPDGPDRLCSVALVRMVRVGGLWTRAAAVSWKADPCRPVPDGAARVNGFHWSGDGSAVPPGRLDLLGKPLFRDFADQLLGFLRGAPLVFHNAVFDVAVLDAEMIRADLAPIDVPVLCTKKSFSDMLGLGRPETYLKGTNLNLLSDTLGVDRRARVGADGVELHGAEVDADLAAACFAQMEPNGWVMAEDPGYLPHRRLGHIILLHDQPIPSR